MIVQTIVGGKSVMKRGILLTFTLAFSIILAGCFQGEQQSLQEMDPPPNAQAVDNLEDTATNENAESSKDDGEEQEQATETTPRDLYLLDSNGMIAPQTFELSVLESGKIATQALEHLVTGGPVTPMLPNGFQPVLPEGTEILGIDLQEDGTMIVNVSEEFANYRPQDEVKILEAMTHTVTQFDNVEKMVLQMNGESLSEMPVNGTPIGDGYAKSNGINVTNTDTVDIANAQAVTMFYPAAFNENSYYIPVTQYVEADEQNKYSSVVEELMDGPKAGTNAMHVFNANTQLTEEPVLEEGVLHMTFSEDILMQEENSTISDDVTNTLVRTLTTLENVEAVTIQVENVEQLVNESGEAYTAPVTREDVTEAQAL